MATAAYEGHSSKRLKTDQVWTFQSDQLSSSDWFLI